MRKEVDEYARVTGEKGVENGRQNLNTHNADLSILLGKAIEHLHCNEIEYR